MENKVHLGTDDNPLSFFDHYLFDDGIKVHYKEFIWATKNNSGYWKEDVFIYTDDSCGELRFIEDSFKLRVEKKLDSERKKAIGSISRHFKTLKNSTEKTGFISGIIEELNGYLQELNKNNFYFTNEIIENNLLFFKAKLNDRYKGYIKKHLQTTYQGVQQIDHRAHGYFQFIYLPNVAGDLFEQICMRFDMFDDNDKQLFIDIVNIKDLNNQLKPITIKCSEVNKAVFILSKMQELFENFNPASIERSELFRYIVKNNSRPIIAGNWNSAISKFNKLSEHSESKQSFIDRVNACIEHFKNTHTPIY